jgi:GNAT superfamily N-acetyltransferase
MIEPKYNSVRIRDARSQELHEISGLIFEAYKEYAIFLSAAGWRHYARDITDVESRLPVSELIVAEVQGPLVGAVTLFRGHSLSGPDTWPASWAGIRLLAVHPDSRGHGIGRALMEECLHRCRESGVATVGLHTVGFMEIARRMYEQMGFVRISEYDYEPAAGITVLAYRMDL